MKRPVTTRQRITARKIAPWERAMRQQLRAIAGPGFLLRQQAGTAQLTVRYSDGSRRSRTLGIDWQPINAPAIVQAAADAAMLVRNGEQPVRAVRQSKLLRSTRVDWQELGERYRSYRLEMLANMSASTWRKKFQPVLAGLVAADPSGPDEAMTAAAVGEPGSRGRAIRLQGTSALLRWAVTEGHLPATWQPPDAKRWLGRRAQPAGERCVASDANLVAAVAAQEGPCWLAVATLLLGGLRPWELRHVQVRGDVLYISKGKTHSGGTTQPRTVALLPPAEAPPHWRQAVLAGLAAGGLPNLGTDDGRVQARLIQLLERRAWPTGLNLYQLRHAYGARSNTVYGLPPRHAAALMGHSLQTHMQYYGHTNNDAAVAAALAATTGSTSLDKVRHM